MKFCSICGKQWFNDIRFCPIDGVPLESDSPSSSLSYLVGQVINHTYRIEAKIGEGSVGTVFKAKHLGIGDIVAIKVIAPANTEKTDSLMRFRREAKAARRLSHPNAVTVYDFNITDGGLLFMVMEYVNGITLEKYLQDHSPLRPQRALEILRPVGAVLDVAHSLGIIHRDLKPANLMLCKDTSGNEQVKVLDFGTARLVLDDSTTQEDAVITTLQGQIFGAPIYTSPEQALSEPVGPTTDIYTLGIILYQMLTGTVPFNAPKAYQVMMAHINDSPDLPSSRNPGLPIEFDDVILRALAKKPEDRYQTAMAMVEELTAVISSLVTRDTLTIPSPVENLNGSDSEKSQIISSSISHLEQPESSVELESFDLPDPVHSGDLPIFIDTINFQQYVGQETALAQLQEEINTSSITQPIFIVGEAGIGKTTLVNQLKQWAESQKIAVLVGGFTEFGPTSIEPLHVLKELLSLLPNIKLLDRSAKSSNLSTAMLREQREEKKWQLFDRLVKTLDDRTKVSPQILIIEDLQWADTLSLEFLGYLLRNSELKNFSFIGTVRAEELNRESLFNNWFKSQKRYFYYQNLELAKLDQTNISLLLENIFQAIGIQQQDIESLQQITEGNPLYLIQLISLLVLNNKISLQNNIWQVEPITSNKVPNTIARIVQEKMALLPLELQKVLKISSAIEEIINFDLLEIITGKTADQLKDILVPAIDYLLVKEENTSQGKILKFYHNLIRRSIYDNISLAEAKALHSDIAKAYNSLRHTKKFRVGAEFAYHNYLAGAWERAFQHGCSVTERAWQHSMLDEVIRFSRYTEDAASNLAELDKDALNKLTELKLLRLQSLLRLNRFREAELELDKMQELMTQIEDASLLALYHLAVLTICNRNGHYNQGIEIGSAGLVLARTVNDEETIRRLIYNIAGCHAHISKLEVAITLFENLYKMSKQAEDEALRCASLCSIGYLQHFAGSWRQARTSLNRARQLAQESYDPYRECLALIFSIWIAEYEGNTSNLHSYYQTGLKLARIYGWVNYEGYLHFLFGRHQAYSAEIDVATAEEALSSSLEIMQEVPDLPGQVIVAPTLALLNARINPSEETINNLRSMCESLAQWGEKLNYCEILCHLAKVEQENQMWDSSLTTYEKALELAKTIPHIDCQWQAMFGLAKYHHYKEYSEITSSYLSQAIEIVEKLKKEFDSETDIEAFLENKKPLYELQNKLSFNTRS